MRYVANYHQTDRAKNIQSLFADKKRWASFPKYLRMTRRGSILKFNFSPNGKYKILLAE